MLLLTVSWADDRHRKKQLADGRDIQAGEDEGNGNGGYS